jgi:hypothetical protein
MAMTIGAEPVVRPNAKKVGVDRYDLAVQLRKLMQPNPDPGESLLDCFHLAQSIGSLAHVEHWISEHVDLGASLDSSFECGQQPNTFHCRYDHPRAYNSVAVAIG